MTFNIFSNTNTFSIILKAKFITDICHNTGHIVCIWFIEENAMGCTKYTNGPVKFTNAQYAEYCGPCHIKLTSMTLCKKAHILYICTVQINKN